MNENNKITLLNEDGKEEEFLVIDIITLDEKEYVVANPEDDIDSYVIFRIDSEEDGEVLTLVDDDDELEAVSEAFFDEAGFDEEE